MTRENLLQGIGSRSGDSVLKYPRAFIPLTITRLVTQLYYACQQICRLNRPFARIVVCGWVNRRLAGSAFWTPGAELFGVAHVPAAATREDVPHVRASVY